MLDLHEAPFLWTTLVFTILLFLLTRYGWQPVLDFIESEEQAYERAKKQAKKAARQLAAVQIQSDKIIERAKERSQHIEEVATATKASLLAEAKAEAADIKAAYLKEGKKILAEERKQIEKEVKKQVAYLSLSVAEKILKKEMAQKKVQDAYMREMILESYPSALEENKQAL